MKPLLTAAAILAAAVVAGLASAPAGRLVASQSPAVAVLRTHVDVQPARKTYRTRNEAKAHVLDYIERFYNPRRRHSTISYLSPVEFEKQALLA